MALYCSWNCEKSVARSLSKFVRSFEVSASRAVCELLALNAAATIAVSADRSEPPAAIFSCHAARSSLFVGTRRPYFRESGVASLRRPFRGQHEGLLRNTHSPVLSPFPISAPSSSHTLHPAPP